MVSISLSVSVDAVDCCFCIACISLLCCGRLCGCFLASLLPTELDFTVAGPCMLFATRASGIKTLMR